MSRILILSLIVTVLAGCAYLPSLRLGKDSKAQLAGKNFYVIQEDAPEPEGVVSGRQAMNEMVKLGKDEPKKDKLKFSSPAEAIEKGLKRHLLDKGHEVRTVSFKGKEKPGNISQWLRRNDIDKGAYLDVGVGGWGMEPHPKDKSHYIVWLNAQMSLVDIAKNEVLAQHTCYSDTSAIPVEEAPTKYELLKDDGALVKKIFRERAQACTREIIERALTSE